MRELLRVDLARDAWRSAQPVLPSYRDPAEVVDDDYPVWLTTGRRLEAYHTRTMTGRAAGLDYLLPEEYRMVVLMALMEEMSYKEISSALSIPLGTVMSRLHRGRKQLQHQLLEYARRKGILSGPSDVATDEDTAS